MTKFAPYSLMEELDKVKDKGPPPVHLWNPDNVKDIDMEIRSDGSWHYMGTPIERQRLVHLFASVLKREGDDYFLVTPVEKCRIKVEDVPFLGILLENQEQGRDQQLTITTNMAESVPVDSEHPLRMVGDSDCYVYIRSDMEAHLNRNVYYQLMELVEQQEIDGKRWHGVWSHDQFFPLLPV